MFRSCTWVCLLSLLGVASVVSAAAEEVPASPVRAPRIQVALLLDTSNSMDGLIQQAKSELWRIVNELVTAKQNGVSPELEVALYEYGNSQLSAEEGYVRRVLPLTRDLDAVSEQLFGLRTNGGSEHCGQVIQRAVEDLAWSSSRDDLKILVIAGNEPFTQGPVDYREACRAAIAKGVLVNTIHCGSGIPDDWKDGSVLADGRAMNINQEKAVVHVAAPQDQEIVRLSEQLNTTYVAYGKQGQEGQVRQMAQDLNANNLSAGSATQRAVCKANAFYLNSEWDLVDAVREKKVDLAKVPAAELPENMRKMNAQERSEYVARQQKVRDELQTKINDLNKEREKFVTDYQKQQAAAGADQTLDQAITKAIREQAGKCRFVFAP